MIFGTGDGDAAAAASTDVDSAVAAAVAKLAVDQVAEALLALKPQAGALGRYVVPEHSQGLAFLALVSYWMGLVMEYHY